MTEGERNRRGEKARQVEINGRHVWVLEDAAGIVELAESAETLKRDHPGIDLGPDAEG